MPDLDRDGNVFVLNLGDDENRFNPDWVGAVNALLAEVAATDGPRALVLSATGKNWSQGLDLEWFAANVEQVPAFIPEVHELYARVLTFPAPVIAAIQGHCYAAGAMLSLAADERIMREDRGYWCLPEADINIPFTHGMDALIKSRLRPQVAHEAMVFATRYGAPDAVAAEIVNSAVGEEHVLSAAVERAEALSAKNGDTLAAIKQRLYAPAVAALRDREANAIPGLGG
ncbi:MAG: enoyl-CoA hydratase/isomerase family protein [Solirubrobacterales bacterium]